MLNSRLLNWYYHTLNPEVGEALAEVKKTNVEVLPIVSPSERQEERIVQLVGTMLKLNERLVQASTEHEKTVVQRRIEGTDRQIDQLVNALYGITERDISVLDGKSISR